MKDLRCVLRLHDYSQAYPHIEQDSRGQKRVTIVKACTRQGCRKWRYLFTRPWFSGSSRAEMRRMKKERMKAEAHP